MAQCILLGCICGHGTVYLVRVYLRAIAYLVRVYAAGPTQAPHRPPGATQDHTRPYMPPEAPQDHTALICNTYSHIYPRTRYRAVYAHQEGLHSLYLYIIHAGITQAIPTLYIHTSTRDTAHSVRTRHRPITAPSWNRCPCAHSQAVGAGFGPSHPCCRHHLRADHRPPAAASTVAGGSYIFHFSPLVTPKPIHS